jgi:hypothetical protein
VIGSSIAYYPAPRHAADVVVIEPDPTYEFAAPHVLSVGYDSCSLCRKTSAWRSTGTRYTEFRDADVGGGRSCPDRFPREGYLVGSGKETSIH